MSDSVQPHRRQPTRLLCPRDSPGKNTGVGCHFLLQCMKVKSEREVVKSCLTLSHPMDCSLPGSSVHGIFQARVLEWGAVAFSDFMVTSLVSGLPWWLGGLSVCLPCRRPGFNPSVGKIPWRRKWQPTPVFLPGESQGWGNLVGCHLRGRTESDTTEAT